MGQTIFALASAPGRAAVAVIRVSGAAAKTILQKLCASPPAPRRAAVRSIRAPGGEAIDQALVLWFPGPGSFTGEDLFELQLHGGPAVVQAATAALIGYGARLAEPGEFTRRAFVAGRMDLSQAEAVADLVDAETDAQRRQALSQLDGELVAQGQAWREALLTALAFLEAQIDFPDEEIPTELERQTRELLSGLRADLAKALADGRGERIRDGLRIALVGLPNAGKSSLLNALIDRDAAIVTDVPGATRDIIEAFLVIDGYKVVIADMAGLREASDAVEVEGVRRARDWANRADLRLWVWDAGQERRDDQLVETLIRPADVLVRSKADVNAAGAQAPAVAQALGLREVESSTQQAAGLAALQAVIGLWIAETLAGSEPPAITRIRHRLLLEEGVEHLDRALARERGAPELIAEDVRLAARVLERLAGKLNPEAVLDRVFSTFCIGK